MSIYVEMLRPKRAELARKRAIQSNNLVMLAYSMYAYTYNL